eukprot:365531-Chlamydomonas_euryale.AAC.12
MPLLSRPRHSAPTTQSTCAVRCCTAVAAPISATFNKSIPQGMRCAMPMGTHTRIAAWLIVYYADRNQA